VGFLLLGSYMVGPRKAALDGPHDVTGHSLYSVVTLCQEKSGAESDKPYWPTQYAQFGGKKVLQEYLLFKDFRLVIQSDPV
jgi:hypothetical protein